ncbi:hypothetical protein GCM10011502_16070 [Oceanisphaera marina]|uniref:diguanylate cyclase n=1 Tax=Oceanisphaera marina TaxID=2017550 RepID=A0ABQ1IL11_9GAMM|nr:diguanylate cyclase [Oceanisphaera marina]GGB43536.1 hypothetical protein GCM10011502_16070 [Oceanisphaera marina]
MTSKEAALDNRLALLKVRFIERTTTQLAAMLEQIADWQEGDFVYDDIKSLYQLLHRLAGSSGTFGFNQLGQQARHLELTIKPVLSDSAHTMALAARVIDADFLARLHQLPNLLQDNTPQLAAIAQTPTSVPPHKTRLLVIGDTLSELAAALAPYGFNIQYCTQPITECELCWHQADIIIGQARELTAIAAWNDTQARRHQQQSAPILCIGVDDSFAARYALAAQGANGLFTQPVDIPRLAERIEQLSREQRELQTSKVLLLDDDRELAEHYRLVLTAAGKEVRVMAHPEGLLAALAEFRPDIVLLDVHMPPYSGVTLARMIRLEPEWLSLPIIYLSSEQDRDQQISALAQGADEFITKPISDQQLVRTVRTLCYRARQVAKLVSCDGLTGLLNHSNIKQALLHEHVRVQRYGHSTTLAMLDLDYFKQVNDRHGHAAGDQVIKALANLLQQRLRNSDHLGRYGGEEFVAILPDCDIKQAFQMFNAICHHFSALTFNGKDGEFHVTVSIGLAELNGFVLAEQALHATDEALYQRKHQGRNGVNCYSPTGHKE